MEPRPWFIPHLKLLLPPPSLEICLFCMIDMHGNPLVYTLPSTPPSPRKVLCFVWLTLLWWIGGGGNWTTTQSYLCHKANRNYFCLCISCNKIPSFYFSFTKEITSQNERLWDIFLLEIIQRLEPQTRLESSRQNTIVPVINNQGLSPLSHTQIDVHV